MPLVQNKTKLNYEQLNRDRLRCLYLLFHPDIRLWILDLQS